MINFQFSIDDGSKGDMAAAGLFHKYGFTNVIFYIPSRWVEHNKQVGREPLSPAEVLELSEMFSVQSHSCTHPMLTRIPLDQAEAEIVDSKHELEDFLGKSVTSFCCPRGYSNPQLQEIIGRHYETARNTLVGELHPAKDPLWQSVTVHPGGRRRKEYEGTTWLNEGRRLLWEANRLDNAGEEIEFSMFAHSWELTREAAWADLEVFLKELADVRDGYYA